MSLLRKAEKVLSCEIRLGLSFFSRPAEIVKALPPPLHQFFCQIIKAPHRARPGLQMLIDEAVTVITGVVGLGAKALRLIMSPQSR